jgi:hypothetical protein
VPALLTTHAKHIELADEIAEDDCASAGHSRQQLPHCAVPVISVSAHTQPTNKCLNLDRRTDWSSIGTPFSLRAYSLNILGRTGINAQWRRLDAMVP